jgi:hypothetical protein
MIISLLVREYRMSIRVIGTWFGGPYCTPYCIVEFVRNDKISEKNGKKLVFFQIYLNIIE